jgi:tRNA wybutosine-synthesizing protein 4
MQPQPSQDEAAISAGLEVRKTANDAILSKLYVLAPRQTAWVFFAFSIATLLSHYVLNTKSPAPPPSHRSAAQLGYFKDDFITFFAHPAQPNRSRREAGMPVDAAPALPAAAADACAPVSTVPSAPLPVPVFAPAQVRRSPLINRGYFSRVQALDQLIAEFVATARAHGLPAQVVSLGAGFDTTYWRLKATGDAAIVPDYYVELDFESSIAQKLAIIAATPELSAVIDAPNPNAAAAAAAGGVGAGDAASASEVHAHASPVYARWSDLAIVGGDLRDMPRVEALLRAHTRLDFSAPTLFLSECVLVYMRPHESAGVLAWAANPAVFTGPVVLATYEQIHPNDPFGRTMVANLAARGCPLLGLPEYPDLAAQRRRFFGLGFARHGAWSMNDVYGHYIDRAVLRRAERIEIFDEFEEWHLIQGHYCISIGMRDGVAVNRASSAAAAVSAVTAASAEGEAAGEVTAPPAAAAADVLPATPYDPAAPRRWFDELAYIEKAPPRRVAGPARSAFSQ